MITLNQLAEIINEGFAPPFLDEGTVEAKYRVRKGIGCLFIRIGRRDIEIDENGELVGAGTRLLDSDSISPSQKKSRSAG